MKRSKRHIIVSNHTEVFRPKDKKSTFWHKNKMAKSRAKR